MTRGRTRAVVNSHEILTGDFTRDRGLRLPTDRLTLALRARSARTPADARRHAARRALLGDAIYANVLMLGAAWQAASCRSPRRRCRAIEINGASVEGNLAGLRASAAGRRASRRAGGGRRSGRGAGRRRPRRRRRAARRAPGKYQGDAARARYRAPGRRPRRRVPTPTSRWRLPRATTSSLAYKDEYEVARLHAETLRAAVDAQFTDVRRMRFHLAPPILGGGRPAAGRASARSAPGCSAPSACSAASRSCAARRSTRSATAPSGAWSGR